MPFRRVWLIPLLFIACTARAELSISVNGVDNELATNIRRHIGSVSERERQMPRLLRQKLDTAVSEALQAMGYYDNHFQYRLEDDQLTLNVVTGIPILWGTPDIQVEGGAAELEAVRTQISQNPFIDQVRLNHPSYERFKRDLLQTVLEYGYLEAGYRESRLLIDIQQRLAKPRLILVSGPRYKIDSLQFSGSELEDQLLQRLSPIHPGDWYRRTKITELRRNLQNTRYFRSVDIVSKDNSAAGKIIDVQLIDAAKHELGVGLGYGTDTGPRTRLRWEIPALNRFGHHFLSEARISEPTQEASASYRIPLSNPLYQNLNITTGWERKKVGDTSSTLARLGSSISDHWGENWLVNYGLNYEAENYRQGSEPRRRVSYLTPGINLTRVNVPPGPDPTHGYKTTFSVLGSSQKLGAELGFLRASAQHKQIISLGGSRLLIARATVGAIATEDIFRVPASKRFFTGGDQSVRGYDYETIASRDSQGELIGGRYLNVASLEYSARFAEHWRLAVFSDAGRAYNDNSESWHNSAGFGVRWLSPVGQVRIDLAFPINDDIHRDFRLHIFMGPPL